MCSRFYVAGDNITKRLPRLDSGRIIVSYNTAPTDAATILMADEDGEMEMKEAKWGLRPPGASYPMINAKVETVLKLGAFKKSFSERRCLVPASAFFEWATIDGKKLPHMYSLANGDDFCFAGFYSEFPDHNEFCILTTEPNELVKVVHDRMPVLLAPECYDDYLRGKADDARAIALPPFPSELMIDTPVSTRINSSKYKASDAIQPLSGNALGSLFD